MSLRSKLAAGTLLLAISATPVLAADGDCRLIRGAGTPDTADDVSVCTQVNYFHESDSKVGNLADELPGWDTNAPAASVAAGAGGGSVAAAVLAQNTSRHTQQNDAVFEGTFDGVLDSFGVSMYLFTTARTGTANQAVALQLTVDGKTLYTTGSEADRTPLRSGGNAVQVADFGFTNLYDRMMAAGLDMSPEATHTIRVSVSNWFSVNDNAVYVYDTTEAPSSITFNPDSVAGLSIKL